MAAGQTNGQNPLTLTVFMDMMRKVIVVGGSILVFIMVFQAGSALWVKLNPAAAPCEPIMPTMLYSFLPHLQFPANQTGFHPTSFILAYQGSSDVGSLPSFGEDNCPGSPRNIKVYQVTTSAYSLLADQRARELARTYGFVDEPQALDSSTYRFFTSDEVLTKQLQIDLRTFSFTLTTNFLTNADFLQGAGNGKQLPNRTTAATEVQDYLKLAGILPADLSGTAAQVDYVKAVGDHVEPVETFYEADFLAVSLARTPLEEKYEFYGPNNHTSIYAVVARDVMGQDHIVQLDYYYHPIDLENFESYPLRSTAEAFLALQAGEGYVAAAGRNPQVIIDGVKMGYYEDPSDGNYLQPIYVFSSSDGFVAYVSAVDPRVTE